MNNSSTSSNSSLKNHHVNVEHDYFSRQSSDYSQFRPSYPSELYEHILQHININDRNVAVDIGCGNGQAAVILAKYFKKVIGIEPSANQLQNAIEKENVEYYNGKAEDLNFLSSDSIDLLTVAQALHWFDLETFFKQAHRVLRKGKGIFAAWGYALNELRQNETANDLMKQFHTEKLGPYWSNRRELVDHHYSNIKFPFQNVKRIDLEMTKEMTFNSFIKYLSTWSSYQNYIAEKNDHDILNDEFKPQLKNIMNIQNEETDLIQVTWPLFLVIGLNPIDS